MQYLSVSLVVGLLLATATGCGSSTTSSNGTTPATACADVAHAQCVKHEACSLASFANDHSYGSEADCEARVAPSCVNALAAQGTGQSPANIESCVAQYPNYSCTDFRDNNPSGACLPPAGTRANGAVCGANAQCTSTFCHIAQNETCGVCAAQPVADAPCSYAGDCGRNLGCAIASSATTGTCAARVASAGTCLTNTNPCQAGYACVGDNETNATSGTCQSQGNTLGAACDRSRKTEANCDAEFGLTCVPTAAGSSVGTCQAITLVGAGQTCGVLGSAPITGEALCNAGGLCAKVNTSDATGTCVAAAADGAACDSDTSVGPPCLPPAKCVAITAGTTAGTCIVPDATKCQ